MIQKKTVLMVLYVTACALTGCDGQQKAGVNTDGTCDEGYISSYNDMVDASNNITQKYYNKDGTLNSYAKNNLKEVIVAYGEMASTCDKFQNKYKYSDCNAVALKSGEKIHTNAQEIDNTCNRARKVAKVKPRSSYFHPERMSIDPVDADAASFLMQIEKPKPQN